MITTKTAGLDPEIANPKPVTGFDYAGQPMKQGSFYNGRPEHQDPAVQVHVQVQGQAAPLIHRKRHRKHSAWTAEKRAAFAERMRNYWLQRKAGPNL
jgi:hypothetical protein